MNPAELALSQIDQFFDRAFHGKKRIATTFHRRVSSVEKGAARGGKKVHPQRINMVFSIARFNTWALQGL